MTNTTAKIEIIEVQATESVKGTVLMIKEQPVIGGGINQTKEENTIYEASIVYEFWNLNTMYLRDEITIEVNEKEITFMFHVTTEDSEWEILTETVEVNGQPYIPTTEEWGYMEEETEEQARIQCEQYEEERLDSWED